MMEDTHFDYMWRFLQLNWYEERQNVILQNI
jgi:hypothetical protein